MKKKKDFLVLAIITVSLLFLFLRFGTITSGYHMTDDQEILRILDTLSTKSYGETTVSFIKGDLDIRYRPVYFVHRIAQASLFGTNFPAWSVYTVVLCVLTFGFFYQACRNLRYSIAEGILFLSITFLGPQMAIWWRLGPNETIGMFFLSLTFYFLSKNRSRYALNSAFFAVSLILASLSKESFTIIIPAVVLYKIWVDKETFQISWRLAFRKNRMVLLPLLVMIFNLYMIIFVVGTNKIGYAGVDKDFFSKISQVWEVLKKLKIYFLILAICLIVALAATRLKVKQSKTLRHLATPLLVFLLITMPNVALYAKSGMTERYFLPATVGFALVLIEVLKEVRYKWPVVAIVLVGVSMFCQRFQYREIKDHAVNFRDEGRDNKLLFAGLREHRSAGRIAVFAADPVTANEATFSIASYVKKTGGPQFYGYPVLNPLRNEDDPEFVKGLTRLWTSWFPNRLYKRGMEKPALILFPQKEVIPGFFRESGIDSTGYRNTLPAESRYALYVEDGR